MTNELSPKRDLRPLCKHGHDLTEVIFKYQLACRFCPLIVTLSDLEMHQDLHTAIAFAERDWSIRELES